MPVGAPELVLAGETLPEPVPHEPVEPPRVPEPEPVPHEPVQPPG